MVSFLSRREQTYQAIMDVQVAGLEVLNNMYPERLPKYYINALKQTANLGNERAGL